MPWEVPFLRRLMTAANKPEPTGPNTVYPSLGSFHCSAGARVNGEMVQESVPASETQERGRWARRLFQQQRRMRKMCYVALSTIQQHFSTGALQTELQPSCYRSPTEAQEAAGASTAVLRRQWHRQWPCSRVQRELRPLGRR